MAQLTGQKVRKVSPSVRKAPKIKIKDSSFELPLLEDHPDDINELARVVIEIPIGMAVLDVNWLEAGQMWLESKGVRVHEAVWLQRLRSNM